jgi:hypothetical protein
MHAGFRPAGTSLQSLRTADFTTIGGYSRVIGHVLWFKRSYPQSPPGKRPAEARHQQGFPHIRSRPLQHQGRGGFDGWQFH